MKVKHLIFILLLFAVAFSAYSWTPTPDELKIIQAKIDPEMLMLKEKLSSYGYQSYFDFITREAISCRMRRMLITSEFISGPRTLAEYVYWRTSDKWEIRLIETTTWDAVNLEYVIHELAHAGAAGTGTDSQGSDKQKEVNARKRQAESWKAAEVKPPRDTANKMARECWATYDMVFAVTGIQRSHDFIKQKLLNSYGYAPGKI